MKIKIKFFVIIVLFFSILIVADKKAGAFTVSKSEAVMEVSSGRILSETNADVELPMASTTKIVTAITVIDNFDVEKRLSCRNKAWGRKAAAFI